MGKQFKQTLFAFAGALGLVGATSTAHAIGPIEVGGWELNFSGNVNGFYTMAECDPDNEGVVNVDAGLACGSNGEDRDVTTIQTGLLPSWFGFSATTNQNDFDIGVTLGYQPGITSNSALTSEELNGGLGLNSSNFRQVFLTFGQSNWGTIKVGRDLGMFAADAILSDMTLLGVGTISDFATADSNTTLGRIGTGYVYADWKAQISWASPNWNGFSMAAGIFAPYGLTSLASGGISATDSSFSQEGDTPRLEGKASYAWEGDYPGKVWASGLYQSVDSKSGSFDDVDSWGLDAGVKVGMGGFELVAYGYTGDALGTTGYLFDAVDPSGDERESQGGYVQGTYKFPGPGTKVGLSYGISQLDEGDGEANPGNNSLVDENRSWIVGVYHPLTEALTLVAEYTATTAEAHNGVEAEEKVIALGAILFY